MEPCDHDYGYPLVYRETEHQKLHITVQKGRSLPSWKKCSCCTSPQYHCPFCGPRFFKPTKLSKLKIHMDGHFNKAVSYGDYTIHRCGLSCRPRQHFHCLHCAATVLRKRDLKVHLSFCLIKRTQTTPDQMSNSSAPAQDPNPIQSTQIPTPVKLASCIKLEELLPSWPHDTRLSTQLRGSLVRTCSEQASKLKPLQSLDLVGACVRENQIKMGAKDHDYSSNQEAEPKENKLHITVKRGRSLPPVKKCSCCPSPQYHCPFCGPRFFKPAKLSKLKIHLSGHIKKAVPYGDYSIHRCGLSCRKQQHFHCLYCTATVLRKRDLKVHLSFCRIRHMRALLDQGPRSFSPDQELSFEKDPSSKTIGHTQSHLPFTQSTNPIASTQEPSIMSSTMDSNPTLLLLAPSPTTFPHSTQLKELPVKITKTLLQLSWCHIKHPRTISTSPLGPNSSLALMQSSEMPTQSLSPTASVQTPSPVTSVLDPNSTSFAPTKLACSTTLEEVLPLRLNKTLPYSLPQEPLVQKYAKRPSMAKPRHSPDLGGICVKEHRIKMEAQEHDYGSNLEENKVTPYHSSEGAGRSLPHVKKCTCCPSAQYHCPFCGLRFFKPTKLSKLKIHMDGHFNKAVSYGDYTIHRCGLSCRKQQHFHCLCCTASVLRKRDLKVHLSFCLNKHTRTHPTSDQGPSSLSSVLEPESETSAPDPNLTMFVPTLSPKTLTQSPSPPTSASRTSSTSFSNVLSSTIVDCSTKLEEVLPLRLDRIVLYTPPQDPLVDACLEHPSKVKRRRSTDPVGACLKEKRIKMEAQDHDYGYSLVDAETEGEKLHITVQRGRSLPSVKKCSCCPSPQYHCPFCGPRVFKPTKLSKLKIHLNGHIKKAIPHGDYTIHRCRLDCRKQQHFHCLYCTTTVLRKRDLKVHLSFCRIKHTRSPLTSDQGPSSLSSVPAPSFEMNAHDPSHNVCPGLQS